MLFKAGAARDAAGAGGAGRSPPEAPRRRSPPHAHAAAAAHGDNQRVQAALGAQLRRQALAQGGAAVPRILLLGDLLWWIWRRGAGRAVAEEEVARCCVRCRVWLKSMRCKHGPPARARLPDVRADEALHQQVAHQARVCAWGRGRHGGWSWQGPQQGAPRTRARSAGAPIGRARQLPPRPGHAPLSARWRLLRRTRWHSSPRYRAATAWGKVGAGGRSLGMRLGVGCRWALPGGRHAGPTPRLRRPQQHARHAAATACNQPAEQPAAGGQAGRRAGGSAPWRARGWTGCRQW